MPARMPSLAPLCGSSGDGLGLRGRGLDWMSVLHRDRIEERHRGAELRADLFKQKAGLGLAVRLEVLAACLVLLDPAPGKGAVLNVGKDLLHRSAGLVGDDL